jgi:TM2 domain-containing membrane protein YozV
MTQKHGVPAVLSFFLPGLGQMIKGEVGKGILIFIGFWVSVAMVAILIGIITTPILYFWQIIDAYNKEVIK